MVESLWGSPRRLNVSITEAASVGEMITPKASAARIVRGVRTTSKDVLTSAETRTPAIARRKTLFFT